LIRVINSEVVDDIYISIGDVVEDLLRLCMLRI